MRSRADVLTFREHVDDFKGQVTALERQGYRFLLPSEYLAWFDGAAECRLLWEDGTYALLESGQYLYSEQYTGCTYQEPLAVITIDDGLDSIIYLVDWLISKSIPCGLSIIGRRLRKRLPESGFARWDVLDAYVQTGLVELLNHTYNMHHLTTVYKDETVQTGPIMESPCWLDDGDEILKLAGDSRYFWDYAHVDSHSWGFPIFGSDPYTSFTVPITSSFTVVSKYSGAVDKLRLWLALGTPSTAGYSAQVRLSINGTTVGTVTVDPVQYATRSQWVEREYLTLPFDTPYTLASGNVYTVTLQTLNAGSGLAKLYAIPDYSGVVSMVTTCQSLVAGKISPSTADFPAGASWPARPAAILAASTGHAETEATYLAYVAADLAANQAAADAWLKAVWTYHGNLVSLTGYAVALYGTYEDGTRVTTRLKMHVDETHTADILRFRCNEIRGAYGQNGRESRYATLVEVSTATSASGPWTALVQFSPLWAEYKWEEVDIPPTVFTAGEIWLRFETLGVSPWGEGLMRVYLDQQDLPTGTYDDYVRGRVVIPQPSEYLWYASDLDWSDAWPTGYEFDIDGNWYYLYPSPPAGHGRVQVELLSAVHAAAPTYTQLCYPFGAYYDVGAGSALTGRAQDVSEEFGQMLSDSGIGAAYTISPVRGRQDSETCEPALRVARYTLGRGLMYGHVGPGTTLNLLAAYAGYLWPDAGHEGVEWQTTIEPDPVGNATARRAPWVDWWAFDAWFYRVGGVIEPGAINNGGTWESEVYADDKTYLQSRGTRCSLVLSNYSPTLDEPDPDIGSYVVNHPEEYVAQVVSLAVDDGWDGITSNLEAIPAADRAAATAFYQALAAALHAAGKYLHITVPAITGTSYDYEPWTGWCDLDALARVVDRLKVMSYTESGAFSGPAPHAPDWFFTAVYDYVDRVVHAPFKARVLVGCNAYGARWDSTAPGTADYIDYHTAYSEALINATPIELRDGEGYWSNATYSAYFGVPGTVRRAVRMAATRGYAGVGVWKADDGDLYELWPTWPELGRYGMAQFIEVSFPLDIARGAVGGPRYATIVTELDSGREDRIGRWSEALSTWSVNLPVTNTDAYHELLAFFRLVRGGLYGFRFRDWADYIGTFELLGVGDDLTTEYQLRKAYTVSGYTTYRTISKPYAGTLVVYVNGVAQPSGWTADYTTGIISFTVAPTASHEVRADFYFDVPVRFARDNLDLVQHSVRAGKYTAQGVELVEVRV